MYLGGCIIAKCGDFCYDVCWPPSSGPMKNAMFLQSLLLTTSFVSLYSAVQCAVTELMLTPIPVSWRSPKITHTHTHAKTTHKISYIPCQVSVLTYFLHKTCTGAENAPTHFPLFLLCFECVDCWLSCIIHRYDLKYSWKVVLFAWVFVCSYH